MYPTKVGLNRERTRLGVTWDGGATSNFAAALLRERARDAAS